jgi:hypothetical protein
MRLLGGLAFLVAIIGAMYAYVVSGSEGFVLFGEATPGRPKVPIWEIVASAAAMLVGLFAGVINERLARPEHSENLLKEISVALTGPGLFRALLASPLIYAGVYAAAQKQPDTVIALIFAFENGFFCQTILQERAGRRVGP